MQRVLCRQRGNVSSTHGVDFLIEKDIAPKFEHTKDRVEPCERNSPSSLVILQICLYVKANQPYRMISTNTLILSPVKLLIETSFLLIETPVTRPVHFTTPTQMKLENMTKGISMRLVQLWQNFILKMNTLSPTPCSCIYCHTEQHGQHP